MGAPVAQRGSRGPALRHATPGEKKFESCAQGEYTFEKYLRLQFCMKSIDRKIIVSSFERTLSAKRVRAAM